MTVNTSDITSGPYTGNDVASQFSYDFRVDNKTQLTVFETTDLGAVSTLTVDVDYTVNNVGTDGGGTIDRIAGALPTNYTWYIRSNYQDTQDTDFESQGGFFPDVHERAFDIRTFISQQQADLINRAVRLPDSYSGSADLQLPPPEGDKTILWSSDGLSLVNGPTIGTFAGYASAAAASEIAAAASEAAAAADLVQTNQDTIDTAADRVQTGLDATATAADLVQTNQDSIDTAADAVQTGLDAASASTSASNASTSEGNASTSESNASTSEGNASASEIAAAASAVAAAAAASAGMYADVVTLTFADSPYTIVSGQDGDLFKVDTSSGNVVINAPDLSLEVDDFRFAVVKDTGDANTVTVQRLGSDTINGGTSIALTGQFQALNIIGDQSTSEYVALDATTGTALIAANNLSDVVSAAAAFNNIKQAASETATGVVEKATTAEANAGTADKFPDAAGVKSSIADEVGDTLQAHDAAIMKTDVAQVMTEQLTVEEVRETEFTMTGTVIDPANGTVQQINLTANRTLTESLQTGQAVTLRISDGASAYTITWPTMTWLSGGAPDLPTTGHAIVEIVQIGSTVYGIHVGDFA